MRTLLDRHHSNIREEAKLARESSRKLVQLIGQDEPVTLSVRTPGFQESIDVPSKAMTQLVTILEAMAAGKEIAIVPAEAELTTAEAASILNVSRPFLVKLLEAGTIPHRKVGTHRRVRLEDVLAFREADDQSREAILDQLVQEAQDQEMGYERS